MGERRTEAWQFLGAIMSVEPISEYFASLPSHDREALLHVLEVAKGALIMDCHERELYQGLCLALWTSVKIEGLE